MITYKPYLSHSHLPSNPDHSMIQQAYIIMEPQIYILGPLMKPTHKLLLYQCIPKPTRVSILHRTWYPSEPLVFIYQRGTLVNQQSQTTCIITIITLEAISKVTCSLCVIINMMSFHILRYGFQNMYCTCDTYKAIDMHTYMN